MELRVLSKGTIIYRSYTDPSNKDGFWYSLNAKDTYGYGTVTGEFRLLKDISLINIIHPNFYKLLKDVVKQASTTSSLIKKMASVILFPLGFEDGVFYREYAKKCGIDHSGFSLVPEVHTESMLNFNNRSRLSITQYDVEMMKLLSIVFGAQCDGIISETAFPDIIRNGWHLAELSVFDKSHIEYVKDYARPVIGGTICESIHMNYVFPIRPDETNEYVKSQISLTDKLLEELKTKTIKMPDVVFYKTPIKIENGDIDRSNITTRVMSCTQCRKTRKARKGSRVYS